jgi:hypothetical protein
MRELLVVLAGTALLWGCVAEAQQKPAPQNKAPQKPAPDKEKKTEPKAEAKGRVFKIHHPYEYLFGDDVMDYAGKYVLVVAALPSEAEAKTRCKHSYRIRPGFLFTGLDPKLWYCIGYGPTSDQPLPDSVLKRYQPAPGSHLSKRDASIKYAGWYQPVDIGSLKVERPGMRFVTALNRKMLLAFSMRARPSSRKGHKRIAHKGYDAQVWTIDTAGAEVESKSFVTCGVLETYLKRFSDGNYLLALAEGCRSYYARFYVWSPDGHCMYETTLKTEPRLARGELLANDEVPICSGDECAQDQEPYYLKWNGKTLVKESR